MRRALAAQLLDRDVLHDAAVELQLDDVAVLCAFEFGALQRLAANDAEHFLPLQDLDAQPDVGELLRVFVVVDRQRNFLSGQTQCRHLILRGGREVRPRAAPALADSPRLRSRRDAATATAMRLRISGLMAARSFSSWPNRASSASSCWSVVFNMLTRFARTVSRGTSGK